MWGNELSVVGRLDGILAKPSEEVSEWKDGLYPTDARGSFLVLLVYTYTERR